MSRRSTPDRLIAPSRAALAAAAPAALAGDATGVHQARVASRRLREVVPVLAADPTLERAARRAIRTITRALGPVRELDVSRQWYASIAPATPLGAGARAALERALVTARAAAMRAAVRALTPARLQAVWTSLDVLAASAGPSRPEIVAVVGGRIARRAAGLEAAVATLGTLYSAERLHAVRIAVKQLRYALEVAGELRTRATAADRRALRAAQDLLGQAHDLHVLGGLVRRAGARVVSRSRTAARDLRRLSRDIESRCRALHGTFLGQRHQLAALAARVGRGPRVSPRLTRPAA